MKKRIYLSALVLVVLGFLSACSDSNKKVLATVGDHEITTDQFKERYTDYIVFSGVEDNSRIRKAILNNMINELLLKQYDDNKEVYDNEEYQKEKKWIFKENLLSYLKDQEVYKNITASDKEVREAFEKMNQTLTARHLYARTKEEADQLYQLLQTGASFKTLAKQVFTDSTLRNNGGYIGSFTWGDMDPNFEDAAYSLKVGEISKPVKTRTGYSIIKVEDKQYNPLLTEYEFHQKKRKIETTIKIRKKNPSEQKFIDSHYDKSKFKVYPDGIKQVLSYLNTDLTDIEDGKEFDNKLVAVYGDREIYSDEVLERIENLPAYHRQKINSVKNLNAAVEGFVIQDILIDIAKEKNYDENEIMLDSYNEMLNNLYLKYKAQAVAERIGVDDSTLHQFYEDNLDFFSTHNEVNVQEIIVDNRNLAENLLQKIKAGRDFGELAKEYSLREWSAKNNGEIGFAPLSKFGILKSTFWDASVGDIIGPREIEGFFGLFKILGKKKSEPIKFDLIRNEVLKVFREDRQNQLLLQYIAHLRDKVDVNVDEDMLTSLNINLLN